MGDDTALTSLLQMVNSTVEYVCRMEGLGMVGRLERRLETSADWTRLADIQTLGLDEIALRKGEGL